MESAAICEDQTCSTCLHLCSKLRTRTCGHICECRSEKAECMQENEQCSKGRKKIKQEEAKVLCTYCIQIPAHAAKTCLICEASLCEKHLNVHNKSPDHVLLEPTTSIRCQKCTVHNEVLKYYCPEDDSIVCTSCFLIGDHKGHQVELLQIASEKKKEKLRSLLKKRILRSERTQNRIKDFQKEMSNVKDKVKSITNQVTLLFTDLRAQLEALERRVLKEVLRQEDQVIQSLSEQVQELQMKLEKLSRQISDTEKRCQMTDPLTVLRGHRPNSDILTNGCDRKMSNESFYQVDSLDELLISMTLHRNLAKIVNNINAVDEFHVLEASEILFDVNTAGDYVHISGDLKTASSSDINLRRPETPERFYCVQVLSTKRFPSGRHSWEVETSNCGDWMIGVAYPTIERKGSHSFLGFNDQSWGLQKYKNKYTVKHNSEVIHIDVEYSCQRYLIYLDHDAGQLSFYQLSDPICHLYTYKTTFKAPLHAAFWVEDDAWVKIVSK
ncbi:E3 ubiquitin/ISG15 ligase TRIM25-like [Hyla sarda]|uniref:E3 ubiquitin/ISG15 ligase TRIM25-like n=1 Tax=Hyla sarda TaxID=327740 RepID=UPI0024C2FB86|nr:E3 ubiquitin/ISG15 ligase TRIM25-like [Hyla sarda]